MMTAAAKQRKQAYARPKLRLESLK